MISGKLFKKALLILPVFFAVPALMVWALTGQQVYDQQCAGCHKLGTYDSSGSPDLLGKGSIVNSYFANGGSHKSRTVAAGDLPGLVAFVNNPVTAPASVSITTASLPGATAGTAYSQTLAATGGTTPYRWSVSAGALPAGLTLGTTGTISGTPTTAGTYSVTVKVTDSQATPATATKALSITVAAAPTSLTVTTSTLAGGTVGIAYSQTLAAGGGRTPYTWALASGTLPAGLTISSTGVITGTPTAAVTSSFTVRVSDSSSPAVTATKAMSITIGAAATTSTGQQIYDQRCASCHSLGTYDTSGSPNLLGKTTVSSRFSGGQNHNGTTLTAAEIVSVDAFVKNPVPPPSSGTLTVSTSALAGATVGAAYSQTLAASGGTAPYSWSYSGTLPPGIVINSAGSISGTPTTAGTYSFTVLAADSVAKTATKSLSIAVGTAVTPMSSSDKTLFVNNCLSCHTPSGLEGRTAAQISTAIAGNVGGMGTTQLKSLSSSNITAIARTLTPTPKPVWNCATCHGSTIPTL
jgi:mono/diheme cytochrome c family protein